jgi:hypothetical protein
VSNETEKRVVAEVRRILVDPFAER